jgi:membrane-bound ClpP family serine protease
MRIGASLLLIAVGAILKFAVTKGINGVDVGTVGIILMVIGVVGLLITLVLMNSRRRTDVIHHRNGTTVVTPNDPVDPADPRY